MGSPPPSPSLSHRRDLPPQPQRTGSRAGMVSQLRKAPFDFPNQSQYVSKDIFLCFGVPHHDVGWKLHVVKPFGLGAQILKLPKSYGRLLAHLYENTIPHKIVFSPENLAYMEGNAQQRGKFITIYPRDVGELLALPDQIESFVHNAAAGSTTASGDRAVAAGVSARWGGLTGPNTVDRQNRLVGDDRTRPRPDWIRDPFDPDSRGADVWINLDLHYGIRDELADFKTPSGKLSPRTILLQEE